MKDKEKKYFGIRDIAKIAGVSTATVSRVINQPETTSDEMRKKVGAIIKEYNYVPNQMAKDLFSQESNSVAIFIYDLSNPFFAALIRELNSIAFKNKFTLIICDTGNDIEKEKEYLRYCQSIRCNKIILTEGVSYDLFTDLKSTQTIACLDRISDKRVTSITSDNYNGVRKLMDYLYNLNHRKIAYAGPSEACHTAESRKSSYLDSLDLHGIDLQNEYIYESGRFSHETGVNALDYFWSLNDRPTAIVCANDQIAQGLIMRAYKMNISIPNDLSVVGFDGIDNGYFFPKITTIRQNIKAIVDSLFKAILNNNTEPFHKEIKSSLVIGESCKKIELD
jgi:DNA-binding LacI/PurR family transcriptional regulator